MTKVQLSLQTVSNAMRRISLIKVKCSHNDRTSPPIMQNSIQRRKRNIVVTQRHRTVNAQGRHTTRDTAVKTIRVEIQRDTLTVTNRRTLRRRNTGTDVQKPGTNATAMVFHHHHPTEMKSTLLTTAVLQTKKKRNMTRQGSLRLQAKRNTVTRHRHQTRVETKDHPAKMESRQPSMTRLILLKDAKEMFRHHRTTSQRSHRNKTTIPTRRSVIENTDTVSTDTVIRQPEASHLRRTESLDVISSWKSTMELLQWKLP